MIPSDSNPVAALYREFLDQRNSGREPSIAEFLARCPEENREELRSALDFLKDSRVADTKEKHKFGDFELVREIGRGGMGVVYEATQISIRRPVALKILSPWTAQEPQARSRLLQEAQALAKLRHPNIVAIFAAGEEDKTPYLAMEYVPGDSLDKTIAKAHKEGRTIPISQIIRWVWRIASALDCAHGAGIIHRDIKPQNIRITPEGRALLLDFGLARDIQLASLTKTGDFHGSPFYASPEQVAAKRAPIDARTDIYSLGITLYECATGSVPFSGETTEQILQQILTQEPEAPRKKNRAISKDLETVIFKAIEKNPADRYLTAKDFANDLEALLELRPIVARPAGSTTLAIRWALRKPWVATTLACVLTGGIVIGLASLAQYASTSAKFRQLLAQTRTNIENAEFDRAMTAADQAMALQPDSPEVLALRLEIEKQRKFDLAVKGIVKAREQLKSYIHLREQSAQEKKEVTEFRNRLTFQRLQAEEIEAGERLERELARHERQREERQFAIERSLETISGLAPGHPLLLRLKADYHIEKWREALANPDLSIARSHQKLVEENDPEGLYRDELLGISSLRLETSPPGAEVYLFRYEEQSTLTAHGEQRLVPVPFPSQLPPEIVPGNKVSYVLRTQGKFLRGDIVLERGKICRVYRRGHLLEIQDSEDLSVRETLAPLFCSPANMAGYSPLDLESIPPGSYLAFILKEGFENQRLALAVGRKESIFAKTVLHPEGTSPAGFLFVAGGIGQAVIRDTEVKAQVDPFWMQETELRAEEYLEFLNDPATLKEIETSPIPIRFPRNTRDPLYTKLEERGPSLWIRQSDGTFSIPSEYRGVPVLGISFDDALAFLRWKNERAREQRQPWIYSLPAQKEWYFAGSGADGRSLTFGNRFDPRWCASSLANNPPKPFASLSFPVDESPFGIFDLSGNLAEFISDTGDVPAMLVGGSWILPGSSLTAGLGIDTVTRSSPFTFGGIRLIARKKEK